MPINALSLFFLMAISPQTHYVQCGVKRSARIQLAAGGRSVARKIQRSTRSYRFIETLESRVFLSSALPSTAVMLPATPPVGGGTPPISTNPNVPISPVAATGTVAGTVLDSNGKAASGAEVTLFGVFELIESDPIPVMPIVSGGSGSSNASPVGFWPPGLATTTDQNGNFTLKSVPVGQYSVSASSPTLGYGKTDVTVTADQTTTANITLAQPPIPPPVTGSGTVAGSVLDSNGTGVAGATVSLLPAIVGIGEPIAVNGGASAANSTTAVGGSGSGIAFPGPIGDFTATTDDAGNFSLSNVPAGSYIVFAYSSTAGSGRGDVVVSDGQTANVKINLQAPPPVVSGSVGGNVKDAQGNAIAGASVTLLPPIEPVPYDGTGGTPTGTNSTTPTGSTGSGNGLFYPLPPIPKPLTTTTDGQGNFNFDTVPVGTYTVLVHQDGFQPDKQTVTVTENQAAAVAVTLQTEAPPPPIPTPTGTGTVKGAVTDSSGAGVQGALVILVPASAALTDDSAALAKLIPSFLALHAKTDASGNFEIDDVPAGDYIAFAAKLGAGFAGMTTTVTAEQTDALSITLSSSLPAPIGLKTANTIVSATKKADAQARRSAALAARKAAIAAKKAAAAAKRAAAQNLATANWK